jgi:hypothetical protein
VRKLCAEAADAALSILATAELSPEDRAMLSSIAQRAAERCKQPITEKQFLALAKAVVGDLDAYAATCKFAFLSAGGELSDSDGPRIDFSVMASEYLRKRDGDKSLFLRECISAGREGRLPKRLAPRDERERLQWRIAAADGLLRGPLSAELVEEEKQLLRELRRKLKQALRECIRNAQSADVKAQRPRGAGLQFAQA